MSKQTNNRPQDNDSDSPNRRAGLALIVLAGLVVVVVGVGALVLSIGDEPIPAAAPAPAPDATTLRGTPPEANVSADPVPGTAPPPVDAAVTTGKKCVVVLSGAGQNNDGAPETTDEIGFSTVTPPKRHDDEVTGSGAFWTYDGAHDFGQSPDSGREHYEFERDRVRDFMDDHACGPSLIVGGSNGGAFAAALYCKGEDFGGRVWGFYFKDPVWDRGVVGCTPSPNASHAVAVHSAWLKHAAENVPDNECDRMEEVDFSDLNPQWYADNWYCQDNRSVSEDIWESETGVDSVLAGNGHLGSFDVEPDLADYTMIPVLWCDWIRDHEAIPAACDWTFSHPWHES